MCGRNTVLNDTEYPCPPATKTTQKRREGEKGRGKGREGKGREENSEEGGKKADQHFSTKVSSHTSQTTSPPLHSPSLLNLHPTPPSHSPIIPFFSQSLLFDPLSISSSSFCKKSLHLWRHSAFSLSSLSSTKQFFFF